MLFGIFSSLTPCRYRSALDIRPSSPDALLNLFSSNQQVADDYCLLHRAPFVWK